MSWVHKNVRNKDGRSGVILEESEGAWHRGLFIRCDDGSNAYVQLNSDGKDSGEPGWEWYCDTFDPALGGAQWLTLGRDNSDELAAGR